MLGSDPRKVCNIHVCAGHATACRVIGQTWISELGEICGGRYAPGPQIDGLAATARHCNLVQKSSALHALKQIEQMATRHPLW